MMGDKSVWGEMFVHVSYKYRIKKNNNMKSNIQTNKFSSNLELNTEYLV